MQKLNMQNNCLIIPQYLRSLGHKITPLVNCKSLSLTHPETLIMEKYVNVMECGMAWKVLTELSWLWHHVHCNADILGWVPKPAYMQWNQAEPKVKSQPAKKLARGCSPVSGNGWSILLCGTRAAWSSYSHTRGEQAHSKRDQSAIYLQAPVMASIWFE